MLARRTLGLPVYHFDSDHLSHLLWGYCTSQKEEIGMFARIIAIDGLLLVWCGRWGGCVWHRTVASA